MAVIETGIAAITLFSVTADSFNPKSTLDLSFCLRTAAAIYLGVRGLSNLAEGAEKAKKAKEKK
jgi:hypothetical protein